MHGRKLVILGTGCLLLGIAGLYLLLEAQTGNFTGSLAYPLLEHSAILGMSFAGMVGWGLWAVWTWSHRQTSWQPARAGRRFQTVVLYTRAECPLCDDAAELLGAYRKWLPPITEVDIDEDAELSARLGEEIPVVQMDGKTRFKGRVNEVLLRRLIEGSPPLE